MEFGGRTVLVTTRRRMSSLRVEQLRMQGFTRIIQLITTLFVFVTFSHRYCGRLLLSDCTSHAFVFKNIESSSRGKYPREKMNRLHLAFETTMINSLKMKDNDSYFDISIDPLVANIFEDERGNVENEMDDFLMESLRRIESGILESSRGMLVWRQALAKGRSPIESDFLPKITSPTSTASIWPPPPLFSRLVKASSSLQLPRLALRHPETISMILRSILRKTFEYARRRMDKEMDADDSHDEEEEDEDNPYLNDWEDEIEDDTKDEALLFPVDFPMDENEIARDVAESLIEEWNEVVKGVSLMDDIFTFEHDLLSSGEEEEDIGDDDGGTAGAAMGFGMRDGIWAHSGWQVIPDLQQQISGIPELKDLMQDLGRRPSAEDISDRRRFEKFAPRRPHPEGGLGAEFDPCLRRESVTGIALSGNPSEMLPSEAVLLCQRLVKDEETKSSSNVLRRLFLAKMAESKLQSYELSGWADVPSIPRTRPLYLNRLPSAPGGPIIVCLDTSWSMSGNRESLSKAVVLACVIEARKQGRECQVVSFSTERKVMETGVITGDPDGIRRLLEFLSHSFGGGTDVTGALKFAINALESNDKEMKIGGNHGEHFCMEAADILLVTDGEIPDPPVPHEVMASIDRLKLLKGIELHGLLIGKSESKPLSRVCTHTHDFLSKYSMQPTFAAVGFTAPSSTPNFVRQKGKMSTTQLYAKKSYYDDDDDSNYRRKGKTRKKGNRKWDTQDEDDEDYGSSWIEIPDKRDSSVSEMAEVEDERTLSTDDELRRVGENSQLSGRGKLYFVH
uniref:VWFA domain-containing protein n=1 Tax=Pseudo-nitzschia australis TaxID=44445 RepID=A0A7S4AFR6_9STRA